MWAEIGLFVFVMFVDRADMVLLVDGEVVQWDGNDESIVVKYLDAHDGLRARRETFLAGGVVAPLAHTPERPLVVVLQGERAAVFADQCEYVLSEEATTCQMVCLRNRVTGATSLCHLDGFSQATTVDTIKALVVDVLLPRDARSTIESSSVVERT